MIASTCWDSINISPLWKNLGTIWCLLMREGNMLGSQCSPCSCSALLLLSSSETEGCASATAAWSVTCVPSAWPAVRSGSHEDICSLMPPFPKLGRTYVCTSFFKTRKDIFIPTQHNSVLNENLSLKEGQPSANQQTIYLMLGIKKPAFCELSLDLGSLSDCWLSMC